MTERPRLLPLLGQPGHSGRDSMTCLYRCGNACDHPVPNASDNPYLGDVVNAGISRRGVVRAGAVGTLVLGLGAVGASPALAAPAVAPAAAARSAGVRKGKAGPLTFKPIPPNRLDSLIVPNGYDSAVVMRWGDPVLPGAPALDIAHQTAGRQSAQFGYNNDFVGVLPLGRDGRRALLVVNHEYTNEELMFPGFTSLEALTVEQLKVAMAAHGLSVVELERVDGTGRWEPARGHRLAYNRRITALETPFRFTGPAAGSALLRTAADPKGTTPIGTLNN
ncbi:PhoX family protein, partial [Actinoplanes sp. NPDC049668]|uniref:PhoX family protein n=1 Tax=unclassified Actinoplanes TaxID=2626549 RepID=UPI0033B277E4